MNLQAIELSKLVNVEEWRIVDKLLEAKLALSCSKLIALFYSWDYYISKYANFTLLLGGIFSILIVDIIILMEGDLCLL